MIESKPKSALVFSTGQDGYLTAVAPAPGRITGLAHYGGHYATGAVIVTEIKIQGQKFAAAWNINNPADLAMVRTLAVQEQIKILAGYEQEIAHPRRWRRMLKEQIELGIWHNRALPRHNWRQALEEFTKDAPKI